MNELNGFLKSGFSILDRVDIGAESGMLKSKFSGSLKILIKCIQDTLSGRNLVERVMGCLPEDHSSFNDVVLVCESITSQFDEVEARLKELQNKNNTDEGLGMDRNQRIKLIAVFRNIKDNSTQLVQRLHSIKTLCKHAIQKSSLHAMRSPGEHKGP